MSLSATDLSTTTPCPRMQPPTTRAIRRHVVHGEVRRVASLQLMSVGVPRSERKESCKEGGVPRGVQYTVKKTPGGAGTHTGHTGHTGARGHTDHTDEPHNHPPKPKRTHGRTRAHGSHGRTSQEYVPVQYCRRPRDKVRARFWVQYENDLRFTKSLAAAVCQTRAGTSGLRRCECSIF